MNASAPALFNIAARFLCSRSIQHPSGSLLFLLIWLLLLILGGCAVGPDFVSPVAPNVTQYTKVPLVPIAPNGIGGATQVNQHVDISSEVHNNWWMLFKSTQLNSLVQQALSANPTIQAANATLRQSQNNLRSGYGIFFPTVELDAGASRSRSAPLQTGLDSKGSIYNLVTVSGSIGYPLDIFGGERRMVEGLKAQAEYQQHLTTAAYLTLTANVVNTAIARAAYHSQIQLTQQLIALQQQQLQASQAQYQAGTAAYSTVLIAQSAISASQSNLASLRLKYDQSEHLLAILEGVLPANAKLLDIEFSELELPTNLPLSLPSKLVRQRPDILESEALLHVASANIGVATAALFPSISLSASYGVAGNNVHHLSLPGGRFWSFGPSIAIPIFQGGTLWYQRTAAIDAFDAAQGNYQQTVLLAFAQVADTLNGLEHDAENNQAQWAAQSYALTNWQLLQVTNTSGLTAYADVLAADVQLHQAKINYLQALVQRYQDTVALYVALGGGWWNADQAAITGAAP